MWVAIASVFMTSPIFLHKARIYVPEVTCAVIFALGNFSVPYLSLNSCHLVTISFCLKFPFTVSISVMELFAIFSPYSYEKWFNFKEYILTFLYGTFISVS